VAFAPPTIDELSTIRLRRQPQQDRSRTKVIAAIATAERMLAESGPSSITLNSVAREAGLSVGAIHQYLPDRDAIYAALADRYHHRLQASLQDLSSKVSTPDELVDKSFEAVLSVFGNEANMRSMTLRTNAVNGSGSDHRVKMISTLHDLLVKVGLATDDANGIADATVAFTAIDGALSEAYLNDPKGDPRIINSARFLANAWVDARKAAMAATA
jgi:AcrR family transcriptional regulator